MQVRAVRLAHAAASYLALSVMGAALLAAGALAIGGLRDSERVPLAAASPSGLAQKIARSAAPSAVPAPAPAPEPIFLVTLPLDIAGLSSHREIAMKLVGIDNFMALALSVENVPDRAYVDAAGANVGAGYCIEIRRRIYGEKIVASELARAGFDPREIESLMSREEERVVAVVVNDAQALRLLAITKPQYEKLARNAAGHAVFDALPAHKRDVLSYIAYNTGSPGSFVKLMNAVRSGDDVAALSELAPSVDMGRGKLVKNHRLRAWAQAAWIGPGPLARALSKPVAFESTYASLAGQKRFIVAHWGFLESPDPRQLVALKAKESPKHRQGKKPVAGKKAKASAKTRP